MVGPLAALQVGAAGGAAGWGRWRRCRHTACCSQLGLLLSVCCHQPHLVVAAGDAEGRVVAAQTTGVAPKRRVGRAGGRAGWREQRGSLCHAPRAGPTCPPPHPSMHPPCGDKGLVVKHLAVSLQRLGQSLDHRLDRPVVQHIPALLRGGKEADGRTGGGPPCWLCQPQAVEEPDTH